MSDTGMHTLSGSLRGALSASLLALVLTSVSQAGPGEEIASPLKPIELHVVNESVVHFATFQSHNQKIVSNENGIFLTHLVSAEDGYRAQQWRLLRSTNGGKTFTIVYESVDPTNPPAIETDAQADIYLARPDFLKNRGYLHRFRAEDHYGEGVVSGLGGGFDGKFAAAIDEPRAHLYYMGNSTDAMQLRTVGLDGRLQRTDTLVTAGPNAHLEYPQLMLAPDGVLHLAWTTVRYFKEGDNETRPYTYWDIHYMASPDGGVSWRRLDGSRLNLPAPADDTGPTDRISLDDDFLPTSWLSAFYAKAGKVHFAYAARGTDGDTRHRYVRYDTKTGEKDVDLSPFFSDWNYKGVTSSGLFSSRVDQSDSPLFYVTGISGRLVCKWSRDNGTTWEDYAASDPGQVFRGSLYSIGGAREVTSDGYVIGTFTDSRVGNAGYRESKSALYFYKISTAGK